MAKEVLYRVCFGTSQVDQNPTLTALASLLTITPAILHNHSRRRVRNADYPGVIPQEGHTVRGTYVTGLTDLAIARLDAFEGDQYDMKSVKVTLLEGSRKGEEEDAETYIFTQGTQYLEEVEWDYEDFRRTKMWRWADHSEEYDGECMWWLPGGKL